jgi:hypothetical protein
MKAMKTKQLLTAWAASAIAFASIASPGVAHAQPNRAPAQASGEGMVIAVGSNGKVSILNKDGWADAADVFDASYSGCTQGNVAIVSAEAMFAACDNNVQASSDGVNWSQPQDVYGGAFAVNAEGEAFIISSSKLTVLNKDGEEKDSFEPLKAIEEKSFPYELAAMSTEGVFWAAGYASEEDSAAVVSFDGEAWHTFTRKDFVIKDKNASKYLSITSLLVTQQGEVMVIAGGSVMYRLKDGKFVEVTNAEVLGKLVAKYGYVRLTGLAQTANGEVWIASEKGLFVPNGKTYKRVTIKEGLPSNWVYDVDVDTEGRVWVSTDNGIAVSDGNKWRVISVSNSGLPDAEIVALGVMGAPAILEATDEKKATITGRVINKGKAVANTTIELCSNRVDRDAVIDTPCKGNYFTTSTKTDAKGNYTFADVPIGTYTIAFKDKEGWRYMYDKPIKALEAGEEVTFDVNTK